MALTGWESIVYTNADDAKISTGNISDVKLLQRALRKLRSMQGQETKIRHVERRIRELTECQFKGCRKKAMVKHCDFCGYMVCNDHKGPGNHGGLVEVQR